MPAPIAPFAGFALGVCFAWAAREDLSGGAGDRVLARSLSLVLLFALFVFVPACGYFLVFEPAWSYLYAVEGARRFSALNFITLSAAAASLPSGFLIAAPHARAQRAIDVGRLAAIPAGVALVILLSGLPRLSVRATYAQFHGDFGTEPLAGSSLGWAVLWS
ncbi:MAG TPA: hypothetical protein VGP93_20770, partial [Polyangiaceae bacterium]|nr:hypothetical protein [Polyangiaceae bacterium]